MADFVKLAATAQRLIEKNGREVRIVKANRTAANLSQPWRGNAAAPTSTLGGDVKTAKGCVVPASGPGLGRLVIDVIGRVATAYDQVMLVASNSVSDAKLDGYDQVIDVEADGSETVWKIVARGELRPAKKSLIWVLAVKR